MDFGGDFGSVLVEKNVWPFLVEKMGSPGDDLEQIKVQHVMIQILNL